MHDVRLLRSLLVRLDWPSLTNTTLTGPAVYSSWILISSIRFFIHKVVLWRLFSAEKCVFAEKGTRLRSLCAVSQDFHHAHSMYYAVMGDRTVGYARKLKLPVGKSVFSSKILNPVNVGLAETKALNYGR